MEWMMDKIQQFLDYALSQEEIVVKYTKSDIILLVHSNVLYLSEPKARSCVGGHHFLGSDHNNQQNNSPAHKISAILKRVMASTAETEIGGSLSMQEPWSQHVVRSRNLDINNPRCQYKQTTRRQTDSRTTTSSPRQPSALIWTGTGSKTARPKNSSSFIVGRGAIIWRIISPSITHLLATEQWDKSTWHLIINSNVVQQPQLEKFNHRKSVANIGTQVTWECWHHRKDTTLKRSLGFSPMRAKCASWNIKSQN